MSVCVSVYREVGERGGREKEGGGRGEEEERKRSKKWK